MTKRELDEETMLVAKARAKLALVAAEEEKHWCDLSRLSDYRDLFLFVGFLLVVVGIGIWSRPAAMIVAGFGLITGSWLMSK